MGIVDTVKEWVFSIALKKGVQKAVQTLVALLTAKVSVDTLASMGVTVDSDKLLVGGTALAMGGLEVLRNFLKVKFGMKWL